MIGIIGTSGAVGAAAERQLQAWNVAPLRTGSRSGGAGRVTVDATDGASLRRFCEGCRVIINCSGPSSPEFVESVARIAFDAGAGYVEPAGGDFVFDIVARAHQSHPHCTALVAAGMMPGLTALLPRYVAGSASASRLIAYIGGRGAFTRSAAVDYLATLGDGRALAAWRGGMRVAGALAPLIDVELPFFPGIVNAYPYLSSEAERLARTMRLTDARWYTVFDGTQVPAALNRAHAGARGESAERLVRAAALDLFGRMPYQRMVITLDDRTLVLHARDGSELTGTFAAVAALFLARNDVPVGVHYAGEVLDPTTVVAALRATAAVTAIEMPEMPPGRDTPLFEEGTL